MSNCQDTCQLPQVHLENSGVFESAERLAGLLIDSPEFQQFVQLAQAVNHDAEVNALFQQMRAHEIPQYMTEARESLEELNARLEALPQVVAYRRAEQAVRALFAAVDQVIGQAAGVDFAATARAACG